MAKIENVDQYLDSISIWSDEIQRLVKILRGCSMDESIKWGVPVYSFKSKNIVGVSGFKSYFGLWFYQGALIDDPHQVLINAQEGKTRGMRQWRMTSSKEIRVTWIKTLIKSSKAIVEQGKEIKPRRNKPLDVPELLANALEKRKKLKSAFDSLSLSCQREYTEYIAEAKREETKLRRLEKILPMIEASKGLHDKYR